MLIGFSLNVMSDTGFLIFSDNCWNGGKMKEKEITFKMIRTNIIHRRITESCLEGVGVFQGQHRILMELSENEYQSQKEIAAAMKVSTATIAIALKKLEKNGYINKIMDEEDNRLNKIVITQKGQNAIEMSRQLFDDIDSTMFEGFSNEEKNKFVNMLDRIEENLLKYEENKKRLR